LRPAAHIGHPQRGAIWLAVDNIERQRGDLADMIWSVAEVVRMLSTYVALAPGDLIFTGTPAGVGALAVGDTIECAIDGVGQLAINIVAPHSGA
jgi:fumarylpyruvate hydrolase